MGVCCCLLLIWVTSPFVLPTQLSQTVSDLTTVLHLKEDEVQYWQSR